MSPSGIPYFILFWPRVTKDCPNTIRKRAGTLAWEKKLKKKGNVIEKRATRGILCACLTGGPTWQELIPCQCFNFAFVTDGTPRGKLLADRQNKTPEVESDLS